MANEGPLRRGCHTQEQEAPRLCKAWPSIPLFVDKPTGSGGPMDGRGIVRRSPWGLAVVALLGLSGCLPASRGWVREQLAEVRDQVVRVEQQVGSLNPKMDRILAQTEQLAARQGGTAEPPPDRRLVVDGAAFPPGMTALTPAARQAIDAVVQQAPELRERQVVVVGHTDSKGSEQANYRLGQQRAAAVARYLLDAHGLDPGRVQVSSAGATQPVGDNATATGRQQNRRVELLVYRDQGQAALEIRQGELPRRVTVELPPDIRQGQLPRRLTEDQRAQLVRTLGAGPQVPLAVVTPVRDDESQAFAKELDALFHTAGWATQGVRVSQQAMRDTPPGLLFVYNSVDETTFAPAVRLQKVFNAVGIAAQSRPQKGMPQGVLTLIVGPQPQ
jgi:outer membrane protein OmpA-like peptidoglycan-associated protein